MRKRNKLTQQELDILRDVNIRGLLGIDSQRREEKISCPFHNERTPSCVLYDDNSFHCFGCGANGRGAIDFLTSTGASFEDTIKELSTYL